MGKELVSATVYETKGSISQLQRMLIGIFKKKTNDPKEKMGLEYELAIH